MANMADKNVNKHLKPIDCIYILNAINGANWDIAHSPGRIKQELYIGRKEAFQAVMSLLNGDSVPIKKITANKGEEDSTNGDAK